MKKVILAGLVLAALNLSFTENTMSDSPITESVSSTGGKITLINDTSDKLSVHTGSGSVSLNPRGGKTSFSCNIGKKVKVDGDVIFTIDDDHCGETIYLSDYVD